MRTGQLCSNPCLVLGHNWIAEANHIDVVLHELFSHLCGLARISDHDRGNRTIVVTRDGETGRFQALSKLGGVRSERVNKICRLLEHVEDFDGRSSNSWRDRVREEVGATLVSQDVDNLLRRSSVPTGAAAESLA